MTRRSLIRVMLSLLLLLSQQMALSHTISHWTGRLAAASAVKHQRDNAASKAPAADQVCEQCLAFAQIASAIGSSQRTFALPEMASSAVADSAGVGRCGSTVCPFQSRAPPAFI